MHMHIALPSLSLSRSTPATMQETRKKSMRETQKNLIKFNQFDLHLSASGEVIVVLNCFEFTFRHIPRERTVKNGIAEKERERFAHSRFISKLQGKELTIKGKAISLFAVRAVVAVDNGDGWREMLLVAFK
jgi:hypothetical protein